jgi:hypothetical protein
MMYDLARAERQHRAIQNSKPAPTFSVRTCTGECRRSRSVGQFIAGSTVCIRCARRAP